MTTTAKTPSSEFIRVKFLAKTDTRKLKRQLPHNETIWGQCIFSFDHDLQDYDWLVVYDDLPPLHGERFSLRSEKLACPRQNTLLVTTEPATIKIYGSAYTSQFGCVLTSQPYRTLPHNDRIYSQSGLQWFYGIGKEHDLSYDCLVAMKPNKTKTIATVCSDKKQKRTLHNQRYRFTQAIKSKMPELDVFGHGVRDMDDKAVALDAYRYHIAIENYRGEHHWTEKLSDSFLGFALPFYYGCTNVEDYFPAESFISIDIFDVEKSYRIITDAIKNNEYEKRLAYIMEARRTVLEEYNLFALLAKEIEKRYNPVSESSRAPGILFSRRALRKKYPLLGIKSFCQKTWQNLLP
jgi:hypothetical protein